MATTTVIQPETTATAGGAPHAGEGASSSATPRARGGGGGGNHRRGRGRGKGRGGGGGAGAAHASDRGAGAPTTGEGQATTSSTASNSTTNTTNTAGGRGGARQGNGRTRGGRGGNGGGRAPHGGNSHNENGPNPPSTTNRRGGGASRRAKFDAALSSSSNGREGLHASAMPFVPPSSGAGFASTSTSTSATASGTSTPIPAPVNQTLVERLTTELSTGEAECSICADNISRTARIWSCTECSHPFHLACISKWASSAVASSSERAQLLASRADNARNPPDPATLAGHWSCPNCNTSFTPSRIPKKYTCFCGRFTDPQPRPPAVPHSCGKTCAKPRPAGCRHACSLPCHPGPCPPCPVVLNEPCHCGKRTVGVRCSAVNDGKPDTPDRLKAKELLRSCGEMHAALLGCGLHRCERECHSGGCGECETVRPKRCFCGREELEGICGATRSDDRVEGCTMPGDVDAAEEEWTGEFACGRKTCDALFDCGTHRCERPCHPHLALEGTPHCPFSPDQVSTCPCGQTALSSLLPSPRQNCTDRIPTCAKTCPKILACGHACASKCHDGPCPSCREPVPLTCRCTSLKTTRLCGEPYRSSARYDEDTQSVIHDSDEFLCSRVCKAQRACGRHQCGRVCCPLAYQEALNVGNKKGKKRAMTLQEAMEEQELQDPLGLHTCDKVCGRKLNCGIHNCELRDHKGACPPCLRADFDELICHCGSTVVLPPIPCNFVIDCRHPCIRPSDCGHPRLPHACHENPECPPCPYLTVKKCACGKRTVPNVRCSTDPKKVSCGAVCGKLLRCGWHRCRKSCHAPGECEEKDDQTCLKVRKHCGHPCPLPCHFPSACPADVPCPKLIPVHCACGHLFQNARCGACDDKPEGNEGRLLKCNDSCAVAKRNAQLAEALGVEQREVKSKEADYPPELLSYYAANSAWAQLIEQQLVEFVKSDKPSLHLPVMKRPQREFVHNLTDYYDLRSESLDEEPRRSVVCHRTSTTGLPSPTLAEALAASRKTASASLNLGSLRRALPERPPNNALYLEMVLGYDEASLSDILRPHTRGLDFTLTWTDEDVLVTFDPATPDLESKLSSICTALRHVIGDTGFCVAVEPAVVGDDGRVARGSWTPVAGSYGGASATNGRSVGTSGGASLKGAWRMPPIKTANSFASLGGGGNGISPPKHGHSHAEAWGAVIGNGHAKPPRAVVAPRGEQERVLTAPTFHSTPEPTGVPTPSLPPPPPVAKEQQDVPDEWDADLEEEPTEQ
ncbi:hypothetical protein JCM10908_004913 [Rhodotorula pacifica]|uniref:Fap1p n=1 Tax=Rhodotorula pacifica TaxID=1495444 RepID=UPI00317F72C3